MRDPAARWAGEIDGGAMTYQTGRDRIRMSVAEARALGDAADAVSGYLFIAVRPGRFVPTDEYRREFSRRIDEIRITGERDYCTRARLMREGIEINVKIHDALRHLAEGNLDHGLS